MSPIPYQNDSCDSKRWALRDDSTVPAAYLAISHLVLWIFIVQMVISVAVFYYFQRKYVWLKKRSIGTILIFDFGAMCYLTASSVRDIVGFDNFSCDLDMWLRIVGAYMVIGIAMLRVVVFRNQLAWSHALDKINFQRLQEFVAEPRQVTTLGRKSIMYAIEDRASHSNSNKPESENITMFVQAYFRSTGLYSVLLIIGSIFVPPLALSIAFQFSRPFYGHGCVNCILGFLELGLLLGSGMVVITVLFINAYHIRREADPLGMLREVKLYLIVSIIGSNAGVLCFLEEVIGRPQGRGIFSPDWILCIALIAMHFIQCPYQVYQAIKLSHASGSSRAGVDSIELSAILESPTGSVLFSKHIVSEFGVENLRFYNQAKSFREHYIQLKDQPRIAMQIYLTFVKPGSVMEVNIPAVMRDKLAEAFGDRVGGENSKQVFSAVNLSLSGDVFLDAEKEIYRLMKTDSLSRFVRTKDFQTWSQTAIVTANGATHIVQ